MILKFNVSDFEAEAIASALRSANNAICEDFGRIIEDNLSKIRKEKHDHKEYSRQKMRERYYALKAEHRCTICKVQLPTEYDRTTCESCREKQKESYRVKLLEKIRRK